MEPLANCYVYVVNHSSTTSMVDFSYLHVSVLDYLSVECCVQWFICVIMFDSMESKVENEFKLSMVISTTILHFHIKCLLDYV